MVVYYWEIYDSVRICWSNLFVNATYKSDLVRDESGSEVWIPRFTVSPIMQIYPSNPVIRKLRLEVS